MLRATAVSARNNPVHRSGPAKAQGPSAFHVPLTMAWTMDGSLPHDLLAQPWSQARRAPPSVSTHLALALSSSSRAGLVQGVACFLSGKIRMLSCQMLDTLPNRFPVHSESVDSRHSPLDGLAGPSETTGPQRCQVIHSRTPRDATPREP